MSPKEEVHGSPSSWVRSHIRFYVESGGKKGHRWHGRSSLLLTTRGRELGRLRRTARLYGQDRDRFPVVASNGGSPTHPAWYLNLFKHRADGLQVGPKVVAVRSPAANAQAAALVAAEGRTLPGL